MLKIISTHSLYTEHIDGLWLSFNPTFLQIFIMKVGSVTLELISNSYTLRSKNFLLITLFCNFVAIWLQIKESSFMGKIVSEQFLNTNMFLSIYDLYSALKFVSKIKMFQMFISWLVKFFKDGRSPWLNYIVHCFQQHSVQTMDWLQIPFFLFRNDTSFRSLTNSYICDVQNSSKYKNWQ